MGEELGGIDLPACVDGWTGDDLSAAGLGRRHRQRLLAAGVIVRAGRGLFVPVEASPALLARVVARRTPEAVISHESASALHGFTPIPPLRLHISVAAGRRITPDRVLIVHPRATVDTAPTRFEGLRVTSRAQTLVDLAATLDTSTLRNILDRRIEFADWHAADALCRRHPRRPGATTLRDALRRVCPRTWSSSELAVARGLRDRGIVMEYNAPVLGYIGDLVCRRGRVVVEIDGMHHDLDVPTFHTDRTRQNRILAAGWRMLRYPAPNAGDRRALARICDEVALTVRRRRDSIRGEPTREPWEIPDRSWSKRR